MDSFLISSNYFNMEDIQEIKITSFWVIISTEENNQLNASHFFLHIKSNSLKIFSFSEEIINVPVSTEFMDFTINVIQYLFRQKKIQLKTLETLF